MARPAMIPFLVGMMLLTGVCNTLLTKYQDMQCVRNCSSPDPTKRRNFEQPVWQTAQMFVGEMACFGVMGLAQLYTALRARMQRGGYAPLFAQDAVPSAEDAEEEDDVVVETHAQRIPLRGWRIALLALPAVCDILGTTLMNIGLLFVAASIYQMTRGALVLFVGLFSVVFLRRRLEGYKWAALVVVVGGVAIVGLAGALEQAPTRPTVPPAEGATAAPPTPALVTVLGVVLIALAQVFTAAQFVLEESLMHRYSIAPLAVVGWEGTFGLGVTLLGMLIAHAAYGSTPAGAGGYFDARTGWAEMTRSAPIWVSSLLIMVSIGGFNFFGLSVTRSVSATSRSTIDTCRTLFIWVVSLGLGWESFKWLQVVGFAGLVYGTFLFNEIVRPPWVGGWWKRSGQVPPPAEAEEAEAAQHEGEVVVGERPI